MFYHIVKIGRPYLGRGYAGPTCDVANVQPGLTYHDFNTVLRDAIHLSSFNPTGFNIVQTHPGMDENGLEKFNVIATVKGGELTYLKETL